MNRPNKFPLLGTEISAVSYREVVKYVLYHAKIRSNCTITALDAHGLAKASNNREFLNVVNQLDVVTPDGHSLKWGLNAIHCAGLHDRVAGPDLMLKICEECAEKSIGVYLYGSSPDVVEKLAQVLEMKYVKLTISGARPSRFRPSTVEEDKADIDHIRKSNAGVVFVGLGCPLQEQWVLDHKKDLDCALIAVGAAFDFHSGNKPRAPLWMQNHGLEWIFRITTEPRRLFRRSIPAVSQTLYKLLFQWTFQRKS